MSLSRLALRLAAKDALCSTVVIASGGPYLTSAGPRVYNSRMDPIEGDDDLAAIEGKPILIVYTEEDNTRPYNAAEDKYPVGEQFVDLVVEAMIAVRGTLTIETPNGGTETLGTLEAPITDEQHEETLDILEAMVRYCLDKRQGIVPPSSCAVYRKIAMEVRAVHSVPQRSADRTVRLAARTIKFLVKVKTEVWSPGASAGALPYPLSLVAGLVSPTAAVSIPAVPGAPPGTSGLGITIYAGVGRQPTATQADTTGSAELQVPSPTPQT